MTWRYILRAFAGLLATVMLSHGSIVLDTPETWTGAGAGNWENTTGLGAFTPANPGGADHTGYLAIQFGLQGGAPAYEEDTIKNATDYNGSYGYTNGYPLALRFDFYAEDTLPLSSVLYVHSSSSNVTWEYAFTSPGLGWQTIEIPFEYSVSWVGPSAGAFSNDLGNVDWIGINIARKLDTIQQDYGIDDWEYYALVPEPASIMTGTMAVLTLGLTYGRRFRKKT